MDSPDPEPRHPDKPSPQAASPETAEAGQDPLSDDGAATDSRALHPPLDSVTTTGIRRSLSDKALPAFLGTIAAALLLFALTSTNDRISRLEDRVDAGFAAIDTRFEAIDARFEAQDAKFEAKFDAIEAKFEAKFDAIDAKIDEINLKLTAVIAALNATTEVDAALDGRLLGASPGEEPAS
ncbi:MAG: hypothetical protein OXF75_11775 [Acidimicrobiaceae bacterium]|nr:hypothetical protein [Acidimicrobiaceae bacterium]